MHYSLFKKLGQISGVGGLQGSGLERFRCSTRAVFIMLTINLHSNSHGPNNRTAKHACNEGGIKR